MFYLSAILRAYGAKARTIYLGLVVALAGAPALSASLPVPPHGFEYIAGHNLAPETPFFAADGVPKNIKSFAGKVVVLNLWATWCAVCVQEIPSLERLSAQLPPEKFIVVAVSQDKGGNAAVKPFLTRIGAEKLPVFVDPMGRLFRDLNARGLPTTFVVSPDGTVIGKLEGATQWDSAEVIAYLKAIYEARTGG